MDNFFRYIKKNRPLCIFVSPHFDDAALSAANLILTLRKYTQVKVINAFTRADKPPYTRSAQRFLSICNYLDAEDLYKARAKEDEQVYQEIGVSTIQLGLIDALWRKKSLPGTLRFLSYKIPEIGHVYPTYRFNVTGGHISRHDKKLLTTLATKLTSICSNNSLVFAPLATGNHVDHLIVRQVCEKLFDRLVLWADFPYVLNSKDGPNDSSLTPKNLLTPGNQKQTMLAKYKTQFGALFKTRMPRFDKETFYFRKESSWM